METQIITREDITFLTQQSSDKLNLILSGMTALLQDNDSKVEALESQNWFQRMCRTVTGKNKCTRQEIQQNHEKLNQYMTQAMTELYQQNCIDRQIMMSLGNQINTIYSEQIQLQQMLGAFASKLNEKIESVDNFHILNTEIEQGVYSNDSPIVAVCKIMSQMDRRCVEDERKLDILRRSMEKQNILNGNEITLQEYLTGIVQIPMEDVGAIYMELGSIRSNFMANLILKMIEGYHFLPDMARKMKNKQSVVESIIRNEQLEPSASLSINDVYADFITGKRNMLCQLAAIKSFQTNLNNEKLKEAENLFLAYELDRAFKLFSELAENGNGRAMYFLGLFYRDHIGFGQVSEDYELEEFWFRKGLEKGDALATYYVTYYLPHDESDEKKYSKDVFDATLKLAAEGDVFAQYELGLMYLNGYGTREDKIKAHNWFRKAAEQGYWMAQERLGSHYVLGSGGAERDYHKGYQWLRKAAEQGYYQAQHGLAIELYFGNKSEKEEAFKWLRKAAAQGYVESKKLLRKEGL